MHTKVRNALYMSRGGQCREARTDQENTRNCEEYKRGWGLERAGAE